MFFHFKDRLPRLNAYWDKYLPLQEKLELPAKTVLLQEGEKSQYYFFIEKGCIRAFFNHDGVDKTVQFFFENEGLASIDSFVNEVPGLVTLETIEPSVIYRLHKKIVLQLIEELSQEPDFIQMMLKMSAWRQSHYLKELISFIRDTPAQRYMNLQKERPHIIQRVPQHYIASYLGISTVHLSRIKSKLAKGKPHF